MKHWKLMLSAAVIAVVANMSFAEDSKTNFPKGWEAHGAYPGSYEVSLEDGLGRNKLDRAISIRAKGEVKEKDFVAITRMVDVAQSRGKTGALSVKFKQTGYINTKDMWVRFFDDSSEIIYMDIEPIGPFDPDNRGAVRGAAAFFRIPQGAKKMEVGFGLRGKGSLEIIALEFFLGEDRTHTVAKDNQIRVPIAQQITNKGATGSIDELNQTLKR